MAKSKKAVASNLQLFSFKKPNECAFPQAAETYAEFRSPSFRSLSLRQRFKRINQTLLNWILDKPLNSFLLPAVIEYIQQINLLNLITEPYHLALFEFWFNQFGHLTDAQNLEVRAKIAGKHIPRDDYQAFFPIGTDKTFFGTHFVTAHLSPDVDTMIASFFGWLDAFAARVGSGRHIWSLPGGPPDSPITTVLEELFGKAVFSVVAKTSRSLNLSATDLISQYNVLKCPANTPLSALVVDTKRPAVLLVDAEENYLGDWHSADVEPVRQVVVQFKSCIHWFENHLHTTLISLFAQKELSKENAERFLETNFSKPLYESLPLKELEPKTHQHLHNFFLKVVGLPQGLNSSFGELAIAFSHLGCPLLQEFWQHAFDNSTLFDDKNNLRDERTVVLTELELIIHRLNQASHQLRDYPEHLGVVVQIKHHVLNHSAQFITLRTDIDDIIPRLQKQDYVAVIVPNDTGKLFALGVVWASDLQRFPLGTVSFRDFCNQEEVKMSPHLSVISVIDHHKSTFQTFSTPTALIGDAQSCNVLVAEQACLINDRYSLGGLSADTIKKESKQLLSDHTDPTDLRLLQRLLQRQAALSLSNIYSIHPRREYTEYLCFLYAILDDTDLLSKVSKRDVECTVGLLNRLVSFKEEREVEIVTLDGIPEGKDWAQIGAQRLLRNAEMYELYHRIYLNKEEELERSLSLATSEHLVNLFLDTKDVNGCCRVGQTKLFSMDIPLFLKNKDKFLTHWLEQAQQSQSRRPDLNLHLHMISTIPSAQEVYEGRTGNYAHRDEMWIWAANNQRAYDLLTSFLENIRNSPSIINNDVEVELLDPKDIHLQGVFQRHFSHISIHKPNPDEKLPVYPIAILKYRAGSLNSRKAMISPYLPRVES